MGEFKLISQEEEGSDSAITFADIMKQVHGGRAFHHGAYSTWMRAKSFFPDATISIKAVRDYVKECPICQKTRNTGIEGLPEEVRVLKPPSYRKAIGIDHVSVTPEDQYGNKVVILLVEHWSHFPQAYPAKDYSAETVAITLFKHFCTFGVFDFLVSDPGSSLMAEVVHELNKYLGVQHRVSLVGRHQSNGCEATGREFLRHLRTLVLDERLVHRWSDDRVLPLINFALCNFPTSETGGFTPFQLKYGSEDSKYFRLPVGISDDASEFIKELDENIKVVRELSGRAQEEIMAERLKVNSTTPQYEFGDFVLFDPKEHDRDFLESKLAPRFLGPYEVISQYKNDIKAKHIVNHNMVELHVSQVKPFFGNRDEAIAMGKLDKNQYTIMSINHYTGNPHIRTSMTFSVTFEDSETVMLPWTQDLAQSMQLDQYISANKELYILRFPAKETGKVISDCNRLVITSVYIGASIFINIRIYDGVDRSWFDALALPNPSMRYVTEARVVKWENKKHTRIRVFIPLFKSYLILTEYDIRVYCYSESEINEAQFVVLNESNSQQYPQIFT
jgi:hypothetical protein